MCMQTWAHGQSCAGCDHQRRCGHLLALHLRIAVRCAAAVLAIGATWWLTH